MMLLAQTTVSCPLWENAVFWSISVLGLTALIVACVRMKSGWGPNSLKAIGIVIVATFASLLALQGNVDAAAYGILGAIAGYLFGTREKEPE